MRKLKRPKSILARLRCVKLYFFAQPAVAAPFRFCGFPESKYVFVNQPHIKPLRMATKDEDYTKKKTERNEKTFTWCADNF